MDFEFPANIKQIGTIGEGRRIYVEDYAYSYLQQFAEAAGYDEQIAFLVGRTMIIDSQNVLFISGAIQGKFSVQENGIKVFTDKSFEYLNEQMEKHFKGLDVVGWMQSQPGYGLFLNTCYANYHMNTFTLPSQVMFLMDPIERVNTFYVWNEAVNDITEVKGYFIYYDKNRGMHEYMLQNKIKTKSQPPIELIQKKTSPVEEIPKEELVKAEKEKKGASGMNREEPSVGRRANPKMDQKKVVNMLVSLSAVLLIISLIMGAGYVQNENRLNSLEGKFSQLTMAYQSLLDQVKIERTASVFAAQDSTPDIANAAQSGQAAQVDNKAAGTQTNPQLSQSNTGAEAQATQGNQSTAATQAGTQSNQGGTQVTQTNPATGTQAATPLSQAAGLTQATGLTQTTGFTQSGTSTSQQAPGGVASNQGSQATQGASSTTTGNNNAQANGQAATTSTSGQASLTNENGNSLLSQGGSNTNSMFGVELVPIKPIEGTQVSEKDNDSMVADKTPTSDPSAESNTTAETDKTTVNDKTTITTSRTIPSTYTVQQGDSLMQISIKFYGNVSMVSEIMALNGMDDADKIFFGKVLKLP